MLEPLSEYICDNCNEIINNPSEGILEWVSERSDNKSFVNRDFKILHHNAHSPIRDQNGRGCTIHRDTRGLSDVGLNELLNENSGMSYLLTLIDPGAIHLPNYENILVNNVRVYIDLVRRLTIPNYENARLYWTNAINDNFFDGDNEANIYSVDNLIRLIETYE